MSARRRRAKWPSPPRRPLRAPGTKLDFVGGVAVVGARHVVPLQVIREFIGDSWAPGFRSAAVSPGTFLFPVLTTAGQRPASQSVAPAMTSVQTHKTKTYVLLFLL